MEGIVNLQSTQKRKLLQIHQKLTIIGLVLLLVTIIIYYFDEQGYPGFNMNYAYVTGIAMIIVFMISFVLFNTDRWKESKKSKS